MPFVDCLPALLFELPMNQSPKTKSRRARLYNYLIRFKTRPIRFWPPSRRVFRGEILKGFRSPFKTLHLTHVLRAVQRKSCLVQVLPVAMLLRAAYSAVNRTFNEEKGEPGVRPSGTGRPSHQTGGSLVLLGAFTFELGTWPELETVCLPCLGPDSRWNT